MLYKFMTFYVNELGISDQLHWIVYGLDPGLQYRIAKAQRMYVTQSIWIN